MGTLEDMYGLWLSSKCPVAGAPTLEAVGVSISSRLDMKTFTAPKNTSSSLVLFTQFLARQHKLCEVICEVWS